jgi:hypothetical protein
MGWASANPIFDETARKMQELGVAPEVKTEVLTVLIHELQMRDWDTEGESLGDFAGDEAIVEAFRRNKIIIECEDKNEADGLVSWCERERGDRGHQDGQHEDCDGRKWPVRKHDRPT